MNPLGIGAEGRVFGVDAVDLAGGHPRVDRQQVTRFQSILRDGHVGNLDAILVGIEPHVVANADLGHDDADLGGDALPHALDPFQQIATPLGIGEPNQSHADFDLHRIDGEKIFDPLFGRFLLLLGFRGVARFLLTLRLSQHAGHRQDKRHTSPSAAYVAGR